MTVLDYSNAKAGGLFIKSGDMLKASATVWEIIEVLKTRTGPVIVFKQAEREDNQAFSAPLSLLVGAPYYNNLQELTIELRRMVLSMADKQRLEAVESVDQVCAPAFRPQEKFTSENSEAAE